MSDTLVSRIARLIHPQRLPINTPFEELPPPISTRWSPLSPAKPWLRDSRRISHVCLGSRQGEVRYLGLVTGLRLGFSDYIVDPGATHGNKSTQDSTAYSRTKLAIHMVKKYSDAFPPLASLPRPGTLRCTPYFKPRASQSTHPTFVTVVTPLTLGARGPGNYRKHLENIAGYGSNFLQCNCRTYVENIWDVIRACIPYGTTRNI